MEGSRWRAASLQKGWRACSKIILRLLSSLMLTLCLPTLEQLLSIPSVCMLKCLQIRVQVLALPLSEYVNQRGQLAGASISLQGKWANSLKGHERPNLKCEFWLPILMGKIHIICYCYYNLEVIVNIMV